MPRRLLAYRRFAAYLPRNLLRWVRILQTPPDTAGGIRVFYGHDFIPGPNAIAAGGMVKFQALQGLLPNSPSGFNLLYIVSSGLPVDWRPLLWLARRRNARIVWNQNGVAYPAWHGPGWQDTNRPMAVMLHAADHVFYQSAFCKLSADHFLGARDGDWEILYNAVDTRRFCPRASASEVRPLTLLSCGSANREYRLQTAIKTLHHLHSRGVRARLLIAGQLRWRRRTADALRETRQLVSSLGLDHDVEIRPCYTQAEAPSVYREGSILLHTQYNDACPTVVLEALASGLPVVHSDSGGVPELVGPEAGVSVPSVPSWDRIHPPDPDLLADAVVTVMQRYQGFADAARQRALDHFDHRPWVARHQALFEELVGRRM